MPAVARASELELNEFLRALLEQLSCGDALSVGPLASGEAHEHIKHAAMRNSVVRSRLIWLEEHGLVETTSRNPRRWRITPAGLAVIA